MCQCTRAWKLTHVLASRVTIFISKRTCMPECMRYSLLWHRLAMKHQFFQVNYFSIWKTHWYVLWKLLQFEKHTMCLALYNWGEPERAPPSAPQRCVVCHIIIIRPTDRIPKCFYALFFHRHLSTFHGTHYLAKFSQAHLGHVA